MRLTTTYDRKYADKLSAMLRAKILVKLVNGIELIFGDPVGSAEIVHLGGWIRGLAVLLEGVVDFLLSEDEVHIGMIGRVRWRRQWE